MLKTMTVRGMAPTLVLLALLSLLLHSEQQASRRNAGLRAALAGTSLFDLGSGIKFLPLRMGIETPVPEGCSGPPLRFAVVGDVQGNKVTRQLTLGMLDHNIDLALYPGDLVQCGGRPSPGDSWEDFTDNTVGVFQEHDQDIPIYMVPGNHDLGSAGGGAENKDWQDQFSTLPAKYGGGKWLPNSQEVNGRRGIDQMDYYFDYGQTRFISVTTDRAESTPGSRNGGSGYKVIALEWFKAVLQDPGTQEKDHVFVITHHPVSFGVYDGSGGTGGAFWQAMVESGAPIHGLFVGHWHQYQPGTPDPHHPGLWEMIVGNGNTGYSGHLWQNRMGYTILEVSGDLVTAEFYSEEDNDKVYDDLLDAFVLFPAHKESGLIARYDFEDPEINLDSAASGGAYSLLGKGNHGAYQNGAKALAGQLILDGVDDYATGSGIGDYNLCLLGDMSISVQVQLASRKITSTQTLLTYTAPFGHGASEEEILNQPYHLSIRPDLNLAFSWEQFIGEAVSFVSTESATQLADGGEHEIQVMRDAKAGEVRFFLDGKQLGLGLSFDALKRLPTGGQQGYLHVGANYDRGLKGFFAGRLSQVRIWNQVNPKGYSLGPMGGEVAGVVTPKVSVSKTSFSSGEPIVIAFEGAPGTKQDWITIAPAGAPLKKYLVWLYTDKTKQGTGGIESGSLSLVAAPEAGDYEVRLFENNGYKLLASCTFSVD
jgi:3',5'-cyclic AMP phosphodiesterase CpdA